MEGVQRKLREKKKKTHRNRRENIEKYVNPNHFPKPDDSMQAMCSEGALILII